MTVQYQIDGNIFREITTNWLCATVNEFLIKARQLDVNQAGNSIEYVQLNDGRIFTRPVPSFQAADISKDSNFRRQNTQPVIYEHSLT